MGLISTILGSRRKEREEATRLGITVSEVTKDLPHFSRDGKTVILKPGRCVRYSLARRGDGSVTWTLVQRTSALGASMPNDYLLTASGPVPAALKALLHDVAEEYSEELFEFEGSAIDVAAFWEEWGGVEKVRSLHAHLDRLASW